MYVQDFMIPLSREDLLQSTNSGQYCVQEEFSIPQIREKLEAARTALNDEGTDFIVDHFSTFFSLLQKFKQCPQLTREKGWKILRKGFTLLTTNLRVLFEDCTSIDTEIQSKMCNVTKMLIYVLIEMMKMYQDVHTEQNLTSLDGKAKKKQSKTSDSDWDWNSEKQSVFEEMYTLLQMPLKLLWEPPVVDEEFINLIANICYSCLEDPGISHANSKILRESIFQILGILTKNYLHGLSFCVKVVQLLKMNDHLVNTLAQGVVHIYQICNCTNIVKEIVREVADTDGDQLAVDTAGTRNLNLFIVQLSETIPNAIIPAIDLLISHLNGDSYSMRICVVGVLGEIILNVLTKENLDDNMKKMRDEYLDCLEEHIHDVNAFVRSKVLSIWQKLCIGKAIPILRLNRLLELTIGRLNDKSTNVKKQAVHLIKDLLEGNPFCGQLNISEIESQLQQERRKVETIENSYGLNDSEKEWEGIKKKLKDLLEDMDDEGDFDHDEIVEGLEEEMIAAVGEHLCSGEYSKAIGTLMKLKNEFCKLYKVNNECLNPELIMEISHKIFNEKKKRGLLNVPQEVQEKLEKHRNVIEYLQNALEFSELIDRALPIILTFLDSNVITDVLEAIHFFSAAYLFGFQKALEGVRKMLYLIFSKEANIKAAVSTAYKDLYFQSNGNERQQSIATVKNLGELVLKLNFSQLDALEEVVRQWVKAEVIDKHCIRVMFERFSMKVPGIGKDHSWAALVLIRMVGAQEQKIIQNNLTVLLNEGLRKHGYENFLVAKEICRALQHLLPPKEQGKAFDHTLRYPKDHEMFQILLNLLKIGIWNTKDRNYIPMAEEAINMVFAVCDHPDDFCKNLIVQIHKSILSGKIPSEKKNVGGGKILNCKKTEDYLVENLDKESEEAAEEVAEESSSDLQVCLLTRFISILGQVAANYVLFLEGPVLDELKLRNQLEFERKLRKLEEKKRCNTSLRRNKRGINESEIDKSLNESGVESLEFNRGTADDLDTEEMKNETEKNIVTGDGFLAKFAPLILTVCTNPGKYNNKGLQNAALLSLAKFMQVSSNFCENNLQLLVTICEKSLSSEKQENAMIALGSLQYRFPNCLEPWTPHMCAMLLNPNSSVRYTSILILTDLIMNEMIKVRNHISNLAVCIVDKDIKIARVARHFFREYSQKGNSLYNVLPGLISNLTQCDSPLPSDQFKVVIKYILGLVTKEKQSEHLVEKLCQYFEAATTERQWADLAYCLSLLNYSDKALRKILENIKCFSSKLYLAEVYDAFCSIISEVNKNPQKDKGLVTELDAIVQECRGKTCDDKKQSVCPTKRSVPPSAKKKGLRRRYLPSESDEDDWDKGCRKKKTDMEKKEDSKEDEDADVFLSDESSKRILRNRRLASKDLCVSDDSDKDEPVKKERQKKAKDVCSSKRRKQRTRGCYDSTEEEGDDDGNDDDDDDDGNDNAKNSKERKERLMTRSLRTLRKRKC